MGDFAQSRMKAHMRLRKDNDSKDYDEDDEDEVDEADINYAQLDEAAMAVDSLDITNSTHITRVKNKAMREEYKKAYPFINFRRPNIRSIIFSAAAKSRSKNICVITSGPKGMINDCIRWGAEIGVDVHYEVFDW